MASFAELFRSSKFVALSPKQVLTTPENLKKVGDWGLKHTLPFIKTPFVTCTEQEDTHGYVRFTSAFEKVARIERFKENFPLFPTPIKPPSTSQKTHLSSCTQEEWIKVLQKAKEKRSQWRVLVKEKKYQPHEFAAYLDIEESKDSIIPFPTYNTRQPSDESWKTKSIKGRLLNPIKGSNNFSVSLAGYVGLLETGNMDTSKLMGTMSDRRRVHDFWLLSVDYDAQGEIEIRVSMKPPRLGSKQSHPEFSFEDL